MPKMTHWNSPDAIDVTADKAAVYAAQGWVAATGKSAPKVTAMTTSAVDEEPVKKAPAKKAAAKKTSKAAKKS